MYTLFGDVMRKFFDEFKKFIERGNVIDLAVGVVIGGAFSKIVSSLVSDLFMPIIGIVIGGHDFSGLTIKVGDATIKYGSLIQNIVDFLIIAFCIFLFVKFINRFFAKKNDVKDEVVKSDEVLLLQEIRDLLKKDVVKWFDGTGEDWKVY